MEFDKVIKTRRSVRKYKADEIPEQYISEILEAARLAPSGLNLQPWRYAVLKDKNIINNVAKIIQSSVAASAPVLIVCCADTKVFESTGERVRELYEAGAFSVEEVQKFASNDLIANSMNEFMLRASMAFNAAISIEHIALKATDLGLGSCWLQPMQFDREKIREIINLDSRYDILCFMTIGYADEQTEVRPRLPLNELLTGSQLCDGF
ncbi:MAG: nitroreductase [Eubacterium sp.]|jgi:nitroreductase|nr:nitroreductase [Eubacterium sp.]